MSIMKNKDLIDMVREEVMINLEDGNYDGHLATFEEFFDEVDVINAYEEE